MTTATWRGTNSGGHRGRGAGRWGGGATRARARPAPRPAGADAIGGSPSAGSPSGDRRQQPAALTARPAGSERSWRSRCHCRTPRPARWPRAGGGPRWRRRPASPPRAGPRAAGTSRAGGAAEPGGRQLGQTAPPAATANARCGPAPPHRAQSVKLGPSRRRRAPAAGTRRARGRARRPAASARSAADQQQVQLQRRLPLGLGQPLRGLEHRGARGVAGVVRATIAAAYGAERLGLRDDVERAAFVQLDVDVA